MTTDDVHADSATGHVVEFSFPSGDVFVPALLHRAAPEGGRDLIIALTGVPGNPIEPSSPLAEVLTPHGIDLIRFNYRGTWRNAGALTVTDSVADLKAVIDFVSKQATRKRLALRPTRIYLLGYSYGAAIGLLGAIRDDRIAGVVALAAPDFGYNARSYTDPSFDVRAWLDEAAEVGRESGFSDQDPAVYLEDLVANREQHAFVPRAAALLGRRLLFVMALDDTSCPPEVHFIPLYRALRTLEHPRLEAEVLTTDHGFTGRWPELFARVAAWVVAGRDFSVPKDH